MTLRRALYGMRRVRKLFGKLLRDPLTKADFKPRSPVPNNYCHEQRDRECVVHGDDVMADGEGQQLDYVEQVLENNIELKSVVRAGPMRDRSSAMLKRRIAWTDQGFSWDGDP